MRKRFVKQGHRDDRPYQRQSIAVVLQAVIRIGSRSLKNRVMRGLAAAAFVLIVIVWVFSG